MSARFTATGSSSVGRVIELILSACLGALVFALIIGRARSPGVTDEGPGRPAMMVPVSLAGVIDDRARFRQIFCALDADHGSRFPVRRRCEDALQRLGGESARERLQLPHGPPPAAAFLHIVVVPGMFGECLKRWALPLQDAAAYMRGQGYRVDTINVDGRSSSARNADEIARILPEILKPDQRLLIIGYSKGMSDVLETLFLHPQAIPPGSAIVSLAGIVSGTPLADRPRKLDRMIASIPLPGCGSGDESAVQSLSPQHRLAWLADHRLPRDRIYFSLAAFTDAAHISRPLEGAYRRLSVISSRNDGQVLYSGAILPGSHLLGYLNADHWAVALPLARNVPTLRAQLAGRNDYPREILLEAIVRAVEESIVGPANAPRE